MDLHRWVCEEGHSITCGQGRMGGGGTGWGCGNQHRGITWPSSSLSGGSRPAGSSRFHQQCRGAPGHTSSYPVADGEKGNTGQSYSSGVICPNSTYATNHVRGVTSPKKNKEYVTQVRADFLRLEALLQATTFVWHWVKGYSKEDSREARGNDRVDRLADIGAEEAELCPRLP